MNAQSAPRSRGGSPCGLKAVFSTWGWESAGAEGWLCAPSYAVPWKGLEHRENLVSVRVLGPSPSGPEGQLRDHCSH